MRRTNPWLVAAAVLAIVVLDHVHVGTPTCTPAASYVGPWKLSPDAALSRVRFERPRPE